MKKRNILFFLNLLCSFTPALAGTISGKLIDKQTKSGIEFASISVTNTSDNKPLKSMVTGRTGEFQFLDVAEGRYLLKANFIGYSSLEIPFKVDTKNATVNFGIVEMTPKSQYLKQVEITGRRSQVRFDIDRKVFNVDQSLVSAGGSASELLRNIPSVEVAADGNILLRNNKNVIIWINGRPSGLSDDNRAQILEQIPAETIDRVEVISNPSSKYSPDGSAGIINIVLKKVTKPGLYGSVSIGGDSNAGRGATANIYYSDPKWELNVNAGNRNDVRKMFFNSDRWTYNLSSPDTSVRYSRDKVKIDGDGYFARGSLTYHASSRDHFSLSGMASTADRSVSEKIDNRSIRNNLATLDHRYSISPNNRKLFNLSLDYIHQFKRKEHELRVYLEQIWMDAHADMEIDQLNDVFNISYYQWKYSDAVRHESNFQVDYTYPFGKSSKLEFGYKGEFLTRDNNTTAEYGLTSSARVPQYELFNPFGGSDNRNSTYLNYAGKIKKLSFQTGLRGEYNVMKNRSVMYDKSGRQQTFYFNKNYPGLYPSLFLDYLLPAGHKLQFNYSRRINRPKGRMANPFINIADSANIEYGNPDLTPEYTTAFELNHIKTWKSHLLSNALYYRSTKHVMQTVNYVETVGDYDVRYITMKNITNSESAGFEFMAKDHLFKILDLTSTLNLFYNHLDGFEYRGTQYQPSNNFGWSGRAIGNATLPAGINGQITLGYASKKDIPQGETLGIWGLDAGIRKAFLKRKLQVNITARDILNTRITKDITSGVNFYDYSVSQSNSRMIGLLVAYNFGNQTKKPGKGKEAESNPLGGDF